MEVEIRFLSTSKASHREVLSWCFYDFANSAFATTILAVIFNRYYSGVVARGAEGVDVHLLFTTVHLHGVALFNYIVAVAMLIVAITSPLLGAWADSLGAKKRFLTVYIAIGVVSTAMLAFVGEGEWLQGAFWFILADIAFAGGNVFYNAFLRDLADPDEMGKVSGWGWGIGYLGGGILLAINLVMLSFDEIFTVQHTFLSVAIWWGLFSIPLLHNVRARKLSSETTVGIFTSFRRVKRTFREIKRFKELWKFLLAYLFFNDGIETVVIMAAVFGDQELQMGQTLLIGYFLFIQFTAFIGSLVFAKITQTTGSKKALILSLVVWCAVVTMAYFTGWTGHPVREYFVIGMVAGLVMGASQSIARGLQAEFTPLGREAEFFGFFAISGRFASLFGPLTFGTVVALTGSLRTAILALIVFFIAGILILLRVDENEGRSAAQTEMDT
ncbi:MFS transporter [bacterium]|nr:MFS transporter [bacterium]